MKYSAFKLLRCLRFNKGIKSAGATEIMKCTISAVLSLNLLLIIFTLSQIHSFLLNVRKNKPHGLNISMQGFIKLCSDLGLKTAKSNGHLKMLFSISLGLNVIYQSVASTLLSDPCYLKNHPKLVLFQKSCINRLFELTTR